MKGKIKEFLIRLIRFPLPMKYVPYVTISEKGILRRFSHGNWRLQLGKILTRADYERDRGEVARHAFR